MTTLFIPLALAALGIVLRGANFALRKDAARAGWPAPGRLAVRHRLGADPVLPRRRARRRRHRPGAGRQRRRRSGDQLAEPDVDRGRAAGRGAGRVPVGRLPGRRGAPTAGVPELERYFRRRARGRRAGRPACWAWPRWWRCGPTRRADVRPRRRTRLAAPRCSASLALAATFLLAARGVVRGLRLVAAVGVAGLVWAWGVAQYPYLLPFSLTIADGAGCAGHPALAADLGRGRAGDRRAGAGPALRARPAGPAGRGPGHRGARTGGEAMTRSCLTWSSSAAGSPGVAVRQAARQRTAGPGDRWSTATDTTSSSRCSTRSRRPSWPPDDIRFDLDRDLRRTTTTSRCAPPRSSRSTRRRRASRSPTASTLAGDVAGARRRGAAQLLPHARRRASTRTRSTASTTPAGSGRGCWSCSTTPPQHPELVDRGRAHVRRRRRRTRPAWRRPARWPSWSTT